MTPMDLARSALSEALKDHRVGFAIKASMIGGAYDAFLEKISDVIRDERIRLSEQMQKENNNDHQS